MHCKDEFELVAINDIIEYVKQELFMVLNENKIDLIVQENMPSIFCNKILISCVYNNLIGNSLINIIEWLLRKMI